MNPEEFHKRAVKISLYFAGDTMDTERSLKHENIIKLTLKEFYVMGMRAGAEIARDQILICGASLSRQSTCADIANNIRAKADAIEKG